MPPVAEADAERRTLHRAIGDSALGNLMEWYDYGVYGYAAVIIGRVVFPSHSTTAALLSSFGVLAAGGEYGGAATVMSE